MPENYLYYGDNLEILRRHISDESVDLIYLDPPFNSKQSYNVAPTPTREAATCSGLPCGSRLVEVGTRASARAFADTWRWDETAAIAYEQIVTTGGKIAQ